MGSLVFELELEQRGCSNKGHSSLGFEGVRMCDLSRIGVDRKEYRGVVGGGTKHMLRPKVNSKQKTMCPVYSWIPPRLFAGLPQGNVESFIYLLV